MSDNLVGTVWRKTIKGVGRFVKVCDDEDRHVRVHACDSLGRQLDPSPRRWWVSKDWRGGITRYERVKVEETQ